MDLVVFESEAYNQLQQASFHYMRSLMDQERKKQERETLGFKWVTSKEAAKLLGASERTMLNWRNSGVLGGSYFSGKIYYHLDDLDKALRKQYKKPFAQA